MRWGAPSIKVKSELSESRATIDWKIYTAQEINVLTALLKNSVVEQENEILFRTARAEQVGAIPVNLVHPLDLGHSPWVLISPLCA